MTGCIYNHLLIVGTVCSLIQGMTIQLVNTDTLGDFTEVQPEKLCVRGNPRKGIISIPGARFVNTKQNKTACVS